MDNETLKEAALTLGEGNPGAIKTIINLAKEHGEAPIVALGELGIKGPDIWLLFKDINGEDYGKMAESLADGTAVSKLEALPYR
ncbi:hypothetical protein LCGC14_1056210 [marine sediment metagenome]|uniref:Uncharacterized protein n=1 Tax=marine sediment metagenome TaxID=412755 RepID=A0A0F9QTG2_9ZZZZ